MTLDADRTERYSRQIVIPAIGTAGQERLAAARVRVVGASAAAAPGLLYLALAGVGTIWIDDPESIGPSDAGHWLYPAEAAGSSRAAIASESLQARSRFVRAEPWKPDGSPSATLVLALPAARAVAVADAARKARLPHVVAVVDGDGGTVVTVPPGAPCYGCGRPVGTTTRPPTAAAAGVAALAAEELVLLLADPSLLGGRRIDLVRGVPSVRATTRLVGCSCGTGIER